MHVLTTKVQSLVITPTEYQRYITKNNFFLNC